LHNKSCNSLSRHGLGHLPEWADSWRTPCSFSLSPVGVVPLVPNLFSSPLSGWQVKLPSAVSCLEQLFEYLRIQPSATKSMHPIISREVPKIIGRVPRTIDRVLGNSAESLVVHLTNASYNFRRDTMLKDS
jgi:hypothetical protein